MRQTKIQQQDGLIQIINDVDRILILTHTSPDHDAICSVLLMRHVLTKYLHKEKVDIMTQESTWPQFELIHPPGIEHVINLPMNETIDFDKFDLVFILDAPGIGRCLRTDNPPKSFRHSIIIDHHPDKTDFVPDIFINDHCSSTVEQIYTIFRDDLPKIRTDSAVAYLTIVGIIGDTGRFQYDDLLSGNTFRVAGELYDTNTIEIDKISSNITKYSRISLQIFSHITDNLVMKENLAYSFVTREFQKENAVDQDDMRSAKSLFINIVLRSLEGITWGFLAYPKNEPDLWSISFRAMNGTVMVRPYALELGGGGHEYAAAADIKATSAKDALQQTLKAIADVDRGKPHATTQ